MQTLSVFQEEKEETLNIKEILFLFWQHKWLILNLMVVSLTLTGIYVFRLPDEYNAFTQILIQDIPAPLVQAQTEEIALTGTSDRYFEAQKTLFTSVKVLRPVVQQLGLEEKLVGKDKKPLTLEDAMDRLKNSITIKYKDLIYTLTIKSADPFLAATIANTLTKAYIRQYLEERLYLSKDIVELFPEQAKELESHTSQGKLDLLTQADLIAKLPSVQSDPTVKALQEKKYFMEDEIQKISSKYKEKHPKMIELRTSLRFVEERLNARIDNIVSELKDKLVGKFQDANIKILTEAGIPSSPSGPDRPLILLYTGLVVFALGLGLVMLIDVLDDRINNEDDLARFIHLPFLGAVHRIKKIKDEFKRDSYVLHEPLSETAEAFKLLRVNINFATASEHRKTILVTSTLPQEGKTFITANLAISKAQDGKKILLVDADLRRPRIHKVFNLGNKAGLSNILTTQIPASEVIQKTSIENLDVITSGPPSPNPPEIFASKAMGEFLKDIQLKYETILFDAPPCFGIPDALVLGSMLGATIYVIRAHKSSYKLIAKAKAHLQDKNVRIIGAVLDNLEPSKGKSYYYDYRHYGYSYSREKGESKSK